MAGHGCGMVAVLRDVDRDGVHGPACDLLVPSMTAWIAAERISQSRLPIMPVRSRREGPACTGCRAGAAVALLQAADLIEG
jgi:hypothetical protein